MLLRCSRAAEQLDKMAGTGLLSRMATRAAGGLERAGQATKAVGGAAKKHWKPALGVTLVGGATVPMVASGYNQAAQGMSDQNFQQRMAGVQGPGFPKAPKV